jgi:hypothetical protein
MAYTVTKSFDTVFGNQRVWQGTIAADAATGVVSFGFSQLKHVQATIKTCTSAGVKFAINVDASGTAANGSLAITGAASADIFYVTVYGS